MIFEGHDDGRSGRGELSIGVVYWELRTESSPATGIGRAFLDAYRERSFQYLTIVADRV